MKKKIILCITAAAVCLFAAGCQFSGTAYTAQEDEIALDIQLQTQEDIGLLLIEYKNTGGSGGKGGLSNADKTLLAHDERLFYTLPRDSFDNPSPAENLTLQFTVVSEYAEPNFEDIYPEELKIPLAPLTFEAVFGETYNITIGGDNKNGYRAVLHTGTSETGRLT